MIKTYRKKPVDIEAVQFTRDNFTEVAVFTGGAAKNFTIEKRINGKCSCTLITHEGRQQVLEGRYIVKGQHGEFYSCNKDIFERTYEISYKTSEPE